MTLYDFLNSELPCEEYLDKRVRVKCSNKSTYRKDKIVGLYGTVTRTSSGDIGVSIDGKNNNGSSYGVYWFKRDELDILADEREDLKMEGFKFVAIVNLLEDYNKKDYTFALYEEDRKLYDELSNKDCTYMVVKVKTKDKPILAKLKEIVSIEDYKGVKVTSEVVGIVNIDGYTYRVAERERVKELEKKKNAIEKELEAEINRRKSVEYYEEMANRYSDNPRLAELVAELKELGD